MPHVFERPLLPGWVYPCTTAYLVQSLSSLPPEFLDGLWAVGLVPATQKDCAANARYIPRPKPVIHVYSFPDSFSYQLPKSTRQSDVLRDLATELDYGMRLEEAGARLVCAWDPEDLRRFVTEFVLLHEVGHHVCHQERRRDGWTPCPGNQVCEQFADAFARKFLRKASTSA